MLTGGRKFSKSTSAASPLADDVDLEVLAQRTPGLYRCPTWPNPGQRGGAPGSPPEPEKKITMADMENSIERVIAGPEKVK